MDILRFEGTDPNEWIFKAKYFFDYHKVEESKCLTIASFYMDGVALQWFQGLFRNNLLLTWPEVLRNLVSRFRASEYNDMQGEFKLTQSSSVIGISG